MIKFIPYYTLLDYYDEFNVKHRINRELSTVLRKVNVIL